MSRRALYRLLERHGLHQRARFAADHPNPAGLHTVVDSSATTARRRPRVLVADDTDTIRALFEKLLAARGIRWSAQSTASKRSTP